MPRMPDSSDAIPTWTPGGGLRFRLLKPGTAATRARVTLTRAGNAAGSSRASVGSCRSRAAARRSTRAGNAGLRAGAVPSDRVRCRTTVGAAATDVRVVGRAFTAP